MHYKGLCPQEARMLCGHNIGNLVCEYGADVVAIALT